MSFISAQNEDCSLGDSASGNSERLLQRGGGWGSGQDICDFDEPGVYAGKRIFFFFLKVASLGEQMSAWIIFALV